LEHLPYVLKRNVIRSVLDKNVWFDETIKHSDPLESYYQLEKTRIAEMLKAILSTPGLEVLNAKIVESALPYYSIQNIDFVDAYIVALMQKHGIAGIYSFDKKHLDRITHITRLEP